MFRELQYEIIDFEDVSQVLFLWFTQQMETGVLLCVPIIQERAKFFGQKFSGEYVQFAASVGWVDR